MQNLKNNLLHIKVNPVGAELCAITSVRNDTEFMWNANIDIWGSYAPNLFPIIGALKDNSYLFNNETYNLQKHGFVRDNTEILLEFESENKLVYSLTFNKNTLKSYPFKFKYTVSYILEKNILDVSYTVENLDTKELFFSVGGHPAFKCPLYKDELYSDYIIEFELEETSKTHLLDLETGLVSSKTETAFSSAKAIQLHENLFIKDALIFKDLKSKTVALKHKQKGPVLKMHYKDFNYFGIWAKPNANYVCLEPWLGIADKVNTDKNLKTKEGILTLQPHKNFKASYQIEIDLNHLV